MAVIRGAICAENTASDIAEQAVRLFDEIMVRNSLRNSQVEGVFFTATADLDAAYPAAAVRSKFALDNAAFMCASEMPVVGAIDHCIRVAVVVSDLPQSSARHCYLGKAAILRPDLS